MSYIIRRILCVLSLCVCTVVTSKAGHTIEAAIFATGLALIISRKE